MLSVCSCVVIVIESLLLMMLLSCSHVMLGIGDPVTEQLKLTSTPAAGKTMLNGTMRKVGGAGGTKMQEVKIDDIQLQYATTSVSVYIITPTMLFIIIH